MLREALESARLWPVMLAAILLTACAGRTPLGGGVQGALAHLNGPTAAPRAWSDAMEQRRVRLGESLSQAGVEVLQTPDNLLLLRWAADRAFAGNTVDPGAAADAVWDRVAEALKTGPAWRGRVQGHSDASTADNDAAAALAAQRALAVRNALVQRGLPEAALDVEAWGARAPLVANDTSEGRARNRRVELWLTD